MSYSDFTLHDIKEKLHLQVIEDDKLVFDSQVIELTPFLNTAMERFVPLALAVNTEKARSEWIIAPILAELKQILKNNISVFSGIKFSVDSVSGLDGFCDYIISSNPEQYYLIAPAIIIVEAKKENINEALGQTIATMFAAHIFNQKNNHKLSSVYGVITIGTIWKFLKLDIGKVYIDTNEYYLKELDVILGIFKYIVETARDN